MAQTTRSLPETALGCGLSADDRPEVRGRITDANAVGRSATVRDNPILRPHDDSATRSLGRTVNRSDVHRRIAG